MSGAASQARWRTIACPSCGGSVAVKANGISVSAVCASCGTTLDVASEEVRIIAEAQARTREPGIPLGRRGTLAGTEWEVIGFQLRSNPKEGWTWEEFLLFNPYRGFRFLNHDDEGWTLFRVLPQHVPDPAQADGPRRTYADPQHSEARTDYVLGEFYWRARVGDTVQVTSYTSAPYTLTLERNGSELIWSRGFTLADAAVRGAFGLAAPAPAAAAAFPERERTFAVTCLGIAAICVLLLLAAVGFGRSTADVVFDQRFKIGLADKGRPIVTEPFAIPGDTGNVQIAVETSVNNTWLELDYTLAAEPAGRSYDATQSIEYYFGRDSDGNWTEGSQNGDVLLPQVAGGTYRLVIDASTGAWPTGQTSVQELRWYDTAVHVTIRRNVTPWELFWIALVLLIPYPAWRLIFRRRRQ